MRHSSPSSTAQIVAAGTLLLHRQPDLGWLVPDETAQLAGACLARCGVMGAAVARAALGIGSRAVLRALERFTIPGLALHHALRKRAIEAAVAQARDAGYGRLTVLGAGFDALGVRHSDLEPTEVDHPATQRIKAAGLKAIGAPSPRLVPADLSTPAPLPAGDGSIVVAEGLLMYLDVNVVEDILARVAAVPGRMRLIFTVMEPSTRGPAFAQQSPFVDWWLRSRSEGFWWAAAAPAIGRALRRHGFRMIDYADSTELRRRFVIGGPRSASGESLYVADRPG